MFTSFGFAKTNLTFLIGPDSTGIFHKEVTLFEKNNPDIHVKLVEGPHSTNDRYQMFVTASMSKKAPYDIVWADIIWIPPLAQKGWLLPISDYVNINKLYAQNFKATVRRSIMVVGVLNRLRI